MCHPKDTHIQPMMNAFKFYGRTELSHRGKGPVLSQWPNASHCLHMWLWFSFHLTKSLKSTACFWGDGNKGFARVGQGAGVRAQRHTGASREAGQAVQLLLEWGLRAKRPSEWYLSEWQSREHWLGVKEPSEEALQMQVTDERCVPIKAFVPLGIKLACPGRMLSPISKHPRHQSTKNTENEICH